MGHMIDVEWLDAKSDKNNAILNTAKPKYIPDLHFLISLINYFGTLSLISPQYYSLKLTW